MAVGKRLRFEVLRRDSYACRYCGRCAPEVVLTIDHVLPPKLGGSDDPTNLATACRDCNEGKSSVVPDQATVADVASDAARFLEAVREAGRARVQRRAQVKEQVEGFLATWRDWSYTNSGDNPPLPPNWQEEIENFLLAGLPVEEMVRLVRVAMSAYIRTNSEFAEWRYFYGCCRNELDKLRAEVKRNLESEIGAQAVRSS